MANYSVRHTCGHSTDYTLYGKGTERERKLAYFAGQPCRDCIRDEELRRAQTKAEKQALPALIGTEKQIAWAERIRYEALLVIERTIPDDQLDIAQPIPERVAWEPGETTTLRAVIEKTRRQDDCRWWIDTAKRVHDIGTVPLYGPEEFLREFIPAAAYGDRIPSTGDLAQSGDLRKQLRGLYQ